MSTVTISKPESTTVKTGSYNVPSNRIARVTVTDTTATFTIDGATAVPAVTATPVAQTVANGAGYTVPSDSIFEGIAFPGTATTSTLDVQGLAMNTAPNQLDNLKVGPGHLIDTASAQTYNLVGYVRQIETERKDKVFVVPGGTVLNGTRYVVELYAA